MEALIDFEKPFQHSFSLQQHCDLKRRPKGVFLWESAEDVLQALWAMDGHWDQPFLRRRLQAICDDENFPRCNAIGFWYALLKRAQSDPLLSVPLINEILMCVFSVDRTFFEAATMRLLPMDFVYPEEVENEEVRRHQAGIIQQTIQASSEYAEDLQRFSVLKEKWNVHLAASQEFENWKATCDKLHYADTPDHIAREKIFPIAYIFRQYIELLSGYANSTHQGFHSAWKQFTEHPEESPMAVVLQCIVDTLKQEPRLARIAPSYVLKVFQSKASRIYKADTKDREASCIKLTKRQLFNLSEPILEKTAQSNKKVPRKAVVIVYGILREYYRKTLGDNVDLDLSDYLFERSCSSIGQVRFVITTEMMNEITQKGVVQCMDDFQPDTEWAHPFLQQCSEHLNASLAVYENDAPRLSNTAPSVQAQEIVKDAFTKNVKSIPMVGFVDEYRSILIDGPDSLGTHRWHDQKLHALAELFDRVLAQFPNLYQFACEPTRNDILAAIELEFHRYFMFRISEQAYATIMPFLYQYIYSKDFIHVKSFRQWIADETSRNDGSKE